METMKCPDCNTSMKTIALSQDGYIHYWCPKDGIYVKLDTFSIPANKIDVFIPTERNNP